MMKHIAKIRIHLILDADYYRIIPIIRMQNGMKLNIKHNATIGRRIKCCDTPGGALMKHDIPFVAIKVVAVFS